MRPEREGERSIHGGEQHDEGPKPRIVRGVRTIPHAPFEPQEAGNR
jgi:hypothetical protein